MSRIRIGALSDLPEGRGLRVETGTHRIAVFRAGSVVFAVGDRCSHAEASLAEGEVFDETVECPRHGAGFDLRTGEATGLPATKPVAVYDVVVEEGEVFIDLDEREGA